MSQERRTRHQLARSAKRVRSARRGEDSLRTADVFPVVAFFLKSDDRKYVCGSQARLQAAKVRFGRSKPKVCSNTAARKERGNTCCSNKFQAHELFSRVWPVNT